MKKYLSLILICCLLFGVCACTKNESLNESEPTEQETVKLSLVTADTVELYFSQTDAESSKITDICIGDGKVAGIENDTVKTVDNSVPKEKVVTINGNDVKVKYQATEKTSTDKEDVFNQSFDFYKEGNDEIEYLHNTNQVTEYYRAKSENLSNSQNKMLNEDEVKTLSEKYVAQFLPQDIFSKYSFVSASYDEDVLQLWSVVYRRRLYGYTTDSFVRVWIENDGSLKMYQVRELGKFDHINENITKEHIDAAVSAAEEKINELNLTDMKIRAKTLTTNTNGELFVEIGYEYRDNAARLEKLYAKVG